MTFQTTLRLPIERSVIEATGDLDKMHKFVMKLFPDLGGMSFDASAREAMGVVYRVDLPAATSLDPRVTIVVNSNIEIENASEVSAVPLFEVGDEVVLSGRIRSERRLVKGRLPGQKNSEAERRRTRMVTDQELPEWIDALFSESGMEVSEVGASRAYQVGRRDSIRGYAREITVAVKIADAEKANLAIHRGIGRGKAYGFGLLRVVADA